MLRKKIKRKPLLFATQKSCAKGGSLEDIIKYTYTTLALSVAAKETSGRDVKISSDGTKVYVFGASSNIVHQYNLSTAYKIDTGTFSASYDVTPQITNNAYGLAFKTDGSKMYVINSNNDSVFQYSLGTAWTISTASYDTKTFSVAVETGSPRKVLFSSDGLSMYVLASNKVLFQYTLGTAWDVSTAAITRNTALAIGGAEGYCVAFSTDGKKLYAGGADSIIHQYNLGTAWDLSTASYTGKTLNISSQDSSSWGICFSSDMVYMYSIGSGNDKVYEFKNS